MKREGEEGREDLKVKKKEGGRRKREEEDGRQETD